MSVKVFTPAHQDLPVSVILSILSDHVMAVKIFNANKKVVIFLEHLRKPWTAYGLDFTDFINNLMYTAISEYFT